MAQRLLIRFARALLGFAALLFGSAGTLRWPAGWAFVALLFGGSALITLKLLRDDPALLEERMKPLIRKGQPAWDRILIVTVGALWLAWLALTGLDHRFGLSHVPASVQWLGAAGVVVSLWLWHLALRANTFAAATVRIQTERAHRVVSTGPYAVVRHPLYSTALLFFPATALLLGSWWGLAAAPVLIAGLAIRTALEDRELMKNLPGYRAYAASVRYRLVPLIW